MKKVLLTRRQLARLDTVIRKVRQLGHEAHDMLVRGDFQQVADLLTSLHKYCAQRKKKDDAKPNADSPV